MAKCSKCGKQEMTFTCRYCEKKFCSEHRLPENHDCDSIDEVKNKSGESSGKWFKKKDVKKETIKGTPKNPPKPSLARDVLDTLKNSFTLSIILITSLSFLLHEFSPVYEDFLVLSPALTQAAVDATNTAAANAYGIPGLTILTKTLVEAPWTLLSVMLVHDGVFHIFANMVTFYFFGSVLERKLDRKEMLKFYVGAGLLASIVYIVFRNILFELYGPIINGAITLGPAVGASGAVVAVFAAVAMLYPDAEVLLYFFIPMKIRTALLLFGSIEGINLVFKLAGITLPVIGGFASSAHLAGLIAGVWFGKKLRERYSSQIGVLDLLGY